MRGKGEGSIYKRASDGLWCVRIELPPGLNGQRRQKVICRKDKKQALAEMQDVKAELNRLGDLPTSNLSVEKWLRRWIEDIAPNGDIRPTSYAAYKSTVYTWLIPTLGRHKIDSLTADHVRRMFATIMSTPKSQKLRGETDLPPDTVMVGADTAIKAHAVLSAALKTAMREGKATRNVCEMIDPPRKAKASQKALTREQAIKLLGYLATHPNGPLWTTYLLTGARRGEVLGLEVGRVGEDYLDLSWQLQRIPDISKAGAAYEHRHLQGTLYLTHPKTESGRRVIPLTGMLKATLDLHMQGRGDGLVFTDRGRPWDPDRATKEWAKLLKECGIEEDVVLHGARHTVVDLLNAASVDWDTIKDIVGHSTREMSQQYRTRVDPKRLGAGLDQFYDTLKQQ